MANLLIKRAAAFQDLFRSYEVLVDGKMAGKLGARNFIDLHVPEGPRCVALRLDGFTSNNICYFASAAVPAVFECGPSRRSGRSLRQPNSGQCWMTIRQVNADAVLRGFMHGLAAMLHRRRGASEHEPVILGDFSYSLGDLSILLAATQQGSGLVMTQEGSWNHRLWTHMTGAGWMRPVENELFSSFGSCMFKLTDYGRVEVIDLI